MVRVRYATPQIKWEHIPPPKPAGNQVRLEALGVNELSHLKAKRAYVKRALDYSNIRQSDRLRKCKPPEPKPGLFDARRIGSRCTRKKRLQRESQGCNSKGRGSIYDFVIGICCHFCRQKRRCEEEDCERCGYSDVTKPCLGKTDCSKCHSSAGVFCRACLRISCDEDIEEVRRNLDWICPHCSVLEGKDSILDLQ